MSGLAPIRRMILGAIVVLLAATTAIGAGSGVSAVEPGLVFKNSCDALGGRIVPDKEGQGRLICEFQDGTRVTCDADGKNCTSSALPADGPFVNPLGEVIPLIEEPASVQPLDDPPIAARPQPRAAAGLDAPDQGQKRDHRTGKGQNGKKHGKGGKGRKK